MDQLLFLGAVGTIAVGTLLALVLVAQARPKPFTLATLLSFAAIVIVMSVLHTTTWDSAVVTSFGDWFFDLNLEGTFGTQITSLILMAGGVSALAIALGARDLQVWQRLYWLLMTLVLAFLAVDELYSIHEYLGSLTISDNWRVPYAVGGVLLAALSAVVFWAGTPRAYRLFTLLGCGLAIIGLSGVLLERLVWNAFCPEGMDSCFSPYLFIEEMFEAVGALIILAGLLVYAQDHLRDGWRRGFRAAFVGAVLLWAVWMPVSIFLYPGLEVRLNARPAQADFDGGRLSLVGYAVSDEVITSGDLLGVTLYWRANEPLPENYSLSVHLLSHPEIESVVPSNDLDMGEYPSRAWLPGQVVRKQVTLPIPDGLDGPASYWLMARVWEGPWDAAEGLAVSNSTQPLLTPDTLLLDSVARLPDDTAQTATPTGYQFTSGYTLAGFSLPETVTAGEPLPVALRWQAARTIDAAHTVFVHVYDEAGEAVAVLDRAPFDERFPTQDWVAGMDVVDTWAIALPDTLPTGEYRVDVGTYDPLTGERQAVTDAAGQPVPNNSITLGTFTLTAR